MLYAILKVFIFAAIFAILGLGIYWLSNSQAFVLLVFSDREVRLSFLSVVMIFLVGLVVALILLGVVRFIITFLAFLAGEKNAFHRFFGLRAQKRGLRFLSDSTLALAAGDGKTALSLAYRADRYLDEPVLTNLLIARAAKLAQKPAEAEAAYTKMLSETKGRFVAILGLAQDRLAAGDKVRALKLAEKAVAARPNDLVAINLLFELQIDTKNWAGARTTLSTKARLEKLPSSFVSRREGVMALTEALSLDPAEARAHYVDRVMLAHRLAADLVPAAVLAAKIRQEEGSITAAGAILAKSWSATPHPEIARAYMELVPNEDPIARLKRFRLLLKHHKDHPETRMLDAELHIAAGQFDEARKALGDMETLVETTRSLAILAAIEYGKSAEPNIVHDILARATHASRGAQWVCTHCTAVHPEWIADCTNCDHFDTLEWAVPQYEPHMREDASTGIILPSIQNIEATEPKALARDYDIIDTNTLEAQAISDSSK